MINRILTDESLQVLVFVVPPLLLLLAGTLIYLGLNRPRRIATFPTFSVRLFIMSREGYAFVTYRDKNKTLELVAGTVGGQVDVQIPEELPDEEVSNLVPNLALGLAKLRFQYLIYKKAEKQIIAEGEQRTAITELRQRGFEVEVFQDRMQVKRTSPHAWRRLWHTLAKPVTPLAPQVLRLLRTARGSRGTIDVLARSDSAVERYQF